MLYHNGKEIGAIYHTTERNGSVVVRAIGSIYRGGKLVWENVRSNFITKDGFWIQTKDGKVFNGE